MHLLSAHHIIGFPLVLGFMTGMSGLQAADLEELTQLAATAVKDAMNHAHLTDEQAADLMHIQVGQFRRQLRAEPGAHLSFARLLMLPIGFWLSFGPIVLFLVAKRSYKQIADDVQARVR